MKTKAVTYYRISTLDKKQKIGMQQKAIKDYCLREGIEIIREYSDIGQSGSKESRPQFDLMLNDMRARKFNCIIVYKLDRIGRSLSHLVKLFEEFNKKNIDFVSTTQNINTKTPEGRMFLHMLMVLAEYERELIVARINSGLDKARSEGKTLGRPRGTDLKKAPPIEAVKNLLGQLKTEREIAKKLETSRYRVQKVIEIIKAQKTEVNLNQESLVD